MMAQQSQFRVSNFKITFYGFLFLQLHLPRNLVN